MLLQVNITLNIFCCLFPINSRFSRPRFNRVAYAHVYCQTRNCHQNDQHVNDVTIFCSHLVKIFYK
jgi:hypothetical protein